MFSSSYTSSIFPSSRKDKDLNHFSVYSVKKGNFLYRKGRELAEDVYREVWNTEKLVDGNDYSIIITIDNQVVGNANIQARKSSNLLKSETFFREKHWHGFLDINPSEIAEISGLAIHRSLDLCDRKAIMMLLVIGAYRLCSKNNIKFWTAIQRKALNRMLVKSLKMPFFSNQFLQRPSQELPQDKYWSGSEIPKLYYLDLTDNKMFDVIQSFLLHPSIVNSNPQFISMIHDSNAYYSENELETSQLLATLP